MFKDLEISFDFKEGRKAKEINLKTGGGGGLVTKSCPTLATPWTVAYQALSTRFSTRILEWVVIFFTKGSSWPRNQTQVSCIAGRLLTYWSAMDSNLKTER